MASDDFSCRAGNPAAMRLAAVATKLRGAVVTPNPPNAFTITTASGAKVTLSASSADSNVAAIVTALVLDAISVIQDGARDMLNGLEDSERLTFVLGNDMDNCAVVLPEAIVNAMHSKSPDDDGRGAIDKTIALYFIERGEVHATEEEVEALLS